MKEPALEIARVDHAPFLFAELFRSIFDDPPPPTPAHYAAFVPLGEDTFRTVGYCHVEEAQDFALLGGLCVAPDYRGRGIGERLVAAAIAGTKGSKGFFGYTGDPAAVRINIKLNMEHTAHEHLMVRWLRQLDASERESIVERVAAIGPF